MESSCALSCFAPGTQPLAANPMHTNHGTSQKMLTAGLLHQELVQVVLAKPPSTTTISPLTKRLPAISDIIVSATSSAVTQR